MNSSHNKSEQHEAGSEKAAQSPGLKGVAADGETVLAMRQLNSAVLFAGANEVEIEHHGVRYRLRKTSLGKLILTK